MPQTTGSVALACGLLEVSSGDCTSWTNISGSSSVLGPPSQTRMSGEAYTFDGDGAIIQGGKKEPLELVFSTVYTETAGEAFEYVRALFDAVGCGAHMCVRWSPDGGDVGDFRFSTNLGILVSFTYPPMDAGTGGPIMAGFTLKVAEIVITTITS